MSSDLVFPLLALFVVVVYLVNRIRNKRKHRR